MRKTIKELLLNNKKKLITIALTIMICIISITCIQPRIFRFRFGAIYIAIQCIFAFFMFLLVNFAMNFIKKLREKDKTYKKWLINAIIYFVIMFIILLMIWPGHWCWDEFPVLRNAVNYEVNIWQSYLTVIYMSMCIMIIPSPVGIVIIQNIIASMIFGYVFTKTSEKFNNKIINVMLYIFMATPAIIINNLYPLRLTMYAYVMLLFFVMLIFDKMENNKLTLLKAFKLYVLTIILILWRSEGIIFAILSPVLILLTYNKRGANILKVIVLVIINLLTVCIYNFSIDKVGKWAQDSKDSYGLTIYVNPLSMMLQEELKGKNIQKNLEDIDKVLDIELLKKHPSYKEIPAYWSEPALIKKDFKEHMSAFKKSYIEIILNNFGVFFEARMKTFLATSCMYEGEVGSTLGKFLYQYMEDNYDDEVIGEFLDKYKFSNVINKDLKIEVENFLVGRDATTGKYNVTFVLVFWNIIPTLILMVICGICSLVKKNWVYLGIYISLLGSTAIIFLTAPANYFMYYVPMYISGTLISFIFIAWMTNNRRAKFKKIEKL